MTGGGAGDASGVPLASRTDVGKRRDHNEDALVAELPLVAVADGVGGSARGEVASQLALDTLVQHTGVVAAAGDSTAAARAMEHAVLEANAAVHRAQQDDDTLRGMATTITAAVLRDGGEVVVGHVGDSRLYVINATGARAATDDHSVVAELVRSGRIQPAEAAHHPQRNVITRALGPEPDVTVDAFVIHVGPGDWLLACSDGLTEHVADDELARAVLESGTGDPQAAVDRLVDQANARGGTDNISVVLVQPVPSDVSGELRMVSLDRADTTAAMPPVDHDSLPPAEESGPLPTVELAPTDHDDRPYTDPDGALRSRAIRRTLAGVAIVLVAALGGAFLWSQSYFLSEHDDGRVGIDRGFPVLGMSTPYRTSSIEAGQLTDADRERLVDSHRLLGRQDAERVLEGLPDRVVEDGDASAGDATTGDATTAEEDDDAAGA